MLLSTGIPKKKLNGWSIGTNGNEVPFPLRFWEHSIRSDRKNSRARIQGEWLWNPVFWAWHNHCDCEPTVTQQLHLPVLGLQRIPDPGREEFHEAFTPPWWTTDYWWIPDEREPLPSGVHPQVSPAPLGSSKPMVTQVAPVKLSGSQSKTKKKWI